ncbi:MAG: biotin--[acetyl-CoA-carboxylase] ligase, partial [Aquificota bacterium]
MDRIDKLILKHIGKNSVSGEKLAHLTGISRVAIWKRIKKLEKLGYKITHTKNGYFLEKETDYITPFEIEKFLKSRYLGKNFIFFEETDSTNIRAKEEDFPHGTVVFAESQTAGKGRKGRKWLSEKGKGLYFSVVLKENLNLENFTVLSLLFPVAVKEAIEKHIRNNIHLKWPNDLYINGKKFSGFLIETEIEGNEITKVIAGIGINVNNTEESLKKIETPATSLLVEEKREINRKQLLADILETIEDYIESFQSEKILKKADESLLWKGEEVILPEKDISGKLIGINKDGGLI